MDRDEIALALGVVMDAVSADQPTQAQIDAMGAAALNVATQVVVDLHRAADALERMATAQERLVASWDALDATVQAETA